MEIGETGKGQFCFADRGSQLSTYMRGVCVHVHVCAVLQLEVLLLSDPRCLSLISSQQP